MVQYVIVNQERNRQCSIWVDFQEYAVQVDPGGKYMNNLGLISIDNACEKFN